MRFSEEVDLGFVFIGTLVGAGFASGQEIMLFFTRYGRNGLTGLLLSCLLFFASGYLILKHAIRLQSSSLRDILQPLVGKKFMSWIETILYAYLFIGFYIMLAGSAAVLKQCFDLPYTPCSFLLCMLCVGWLTKGVRGLADFNEVIVPVMMILMVLISYYGIRGYGSMKAIMLAAAPGHQGWWLSALLYFSYNMTSMSVVLASLGKYTRRKQAALGAAAISGVGVFVMALGPYLLTTAYFDRMSMVEIPLLAIARISAPAFYWGAAFILLSAMLTTALSYGYALASDLSSRINWGYRKTLLILALGWPFATARFSKLVATIYPLFGIIGIFFTGIIILRRFFRIKLE